MSNAPLDEIHLAAEIERLKAAFPRTRELYREACVLLFFRFGITPTANRLYQLVRRGSMSTPVAVLAEFWTDLREKSRMRIEHADLPEDLQDAAGELVAALWKRAASAAEASLAALRDDVEGARRVCHFQKTTAPVRGAGRPVCSRLLNGPCQQSYARSTARGPELLRTPLHDAALLCGRIVTTM